MSGETSDIIIVVIGPTGAGKSNLIDKLVQHGKRVGDSIDPETNKIQAVKLAQLGRPNIIIVDTPGFDDNKIADTKILDMVDQWFKKMYKKDIKKPSGILYLHRITDQRMTGYAHKYSCMFGLAPDKVVLVTSMWDKKVDGATAEARETGLKETCWRNMINNGSTYARFLNTPQSAAELIEPILMKKKATDMILLREEVVKLGKRLIKTRQGAYMYTMLQKQVERQEEIMRKLVEQAAKRDNPDLGRELDEEYNIIWNESQNMLAAAKDMKSSKIGFFRRSK